MDDLSANLRARVLETLSLIASEDAQRKYQRDAPHVAVSAELFNQWEDWFVPDHGAFQKAFSVGELAALREFDGVLSQVCDETPQALPPLDDFIPTAQWRKLQYSAQTALARLSR